MPNPTWLGRGRPRLTELRYPRPGRLCRLLRALITTLTARKETL